MERHEYIYSLPTFECVICGCIELDDQPWLPQHEVPEGWQ
jgi:hypothetical protein